MSFPRYPEYKDSGVEWLGEVPAHWGVSKLKWQAAIYSGRGERSETGKFPLYGANGIIGAAELPAYSSDRVLIGRVGSAGAVNLAAGEYSVSDNALVVDNRERLQTRYCYYWLVTQDFSIDVSTTAQPLLTGSQVKDYVVALPPAAEQHAIIAFLDRETAKIDALVAEQEKLIALLTETRQAVISHAVTKGLDPDVPMKDSGVEWLGEVPEHWNVTALRRQCRTITDGAHISPDTENGAYCFVSTKDIAGNSIDFDYCLRTSPESYDYLVRTGCQPLSGDVLFSKDGTIGRTVVVHERRDFVVASSLIIIRPAPDLLNSSFLNYACQSRIMLEQVEGLVKGAGLPRLSIRNLLKVIGVFPPLLEQQAIVASLDRETTRIDELTSEVDAALGLLRERRAALISAAVTGQIDVRCLTDTGVRGVHAAGVPA